MTISEEEKLALIQTNSQCLLLNNLKEIVATNGLEAEAKVLASTVQSAANVNSVPRLSSDIINFFGSPEKIVNEMVQPEDFAPFIDATPAQLSLLQPYLRFYIRESNKDQAASPAYIDTPIEFSEFVDGQKMVDLAKTRNANSSQILQPSSVQGYNVGIKEFNWVFDNKHEGDKIVKANLSLYFGSITELVNDHYLNFVFTDGTKDLKSPSPSKQLSRQQKIKKLRAKVREFESQFDATHKLTDKTPLGPLVSEDTERRDFRQLRVDVGWSMPELRKNETTGLFANRTQEIRFMRAVSRNKQTLLLNLTHYNLNFNQNGSVSLVLEYVASTDAYMLTPSSDILGGIDNRLIEAWIPTGYSPGFRLPFGIEIGETPARIEDFYPDGYLHQLLKYATSTSGRNQGLIKNEDEAELFKVEIDKIQAEIEGLEFLVQLEEILGESRADQLAEAQKYLTAASEAYEEALVYTRGSRYESFLSAVAEAGNLRFAVALQSSLSQRTTRRRRSVSKLKVMTLAEFYANSSFTTATEARNRMETLARAEAATQAEQGSPRTTQQYLLDRGVLDPTRRPDGTAPGNAALTAGGGTILPYIRLSDIIRTGLVNARMRGDLEIILGSFSPYLSGIPGYKEEEFVPLGDIPISLEYFGQWFFDNIMSQGRDVYPFRRFLDDLLNGLVLPIINDVCDEPTHRISMSYTSFTAKPVRQDVRISPSSLVPNTGYRPVPFGSLTAAQSPLKEIVAVLRQQGKPQSAQYLSLWGDGFLAPLKKYFADPTQSKELSTYLIIYALQGSPNLSGNKTEDEKNGIYHFFVGADRGIAKRFNFSEKKLPQLRAMNIENLNKGKSKAGVLILPQDVSLDMVGNQLFRNGSMIFINADMGVGTEVADMLALGGYYRVYKTSNTIRPGEFTTTVESIFERSRTGLPP